MDIEDALRTVLNVFNLPKETQQVERILASLSARLNGISGFENDTAVYQYIYILLMVQTNQNPNVPEKDRLKLEDVLNMCKYVQGGVERERAIRDFNRIVSNPLNNRILYSEDSLFSQKHFSGFETECQSLFLIQEADMKR